ncbi:hypothetical protein niasHT_021271 [Heterodera trifolii]|uniref:Uncharacterized protein n=1 Tax=Heterodera trifolii TaxID=157864 RepID=A0ABD2JNE0_9BILA
MDVLRKKISALPWKQLQMLAKTKKIAANQKKHILVEQLVQRFYDDRDTNDDEGGNVEGEEEDNSDNGIGTEQNIDDGVSKADVMDASNGEEEEEETDTGGQNGAAAAAAAKPG